MEICNFLHILKNLNSIFSRNLIKILTELMIPTDSQSSKKTTDSYKNTMLKMMD